MTDGVATWDALLSIKLIWGLKGGINLHEVKTGEARVVGETNTHPPPPPIHSLSPVDTFTPCLSEAHGLPALSPVLHRDLSTDPTWVNCLFTNREGTYHLLFCVEPLVWRSEYKSKEFWYQLASHTLFYRQNGYCHDYNIILVPFPYRSSRT